MKRFSVRPPSRGVATRGAWGIASQALNSGSNLLLAIMVARSTEPELYGAWALVYVAYIVCLNVSRSVVSMPMVLSRDKESSAQSANARGCLSLALTIGCFGSFLLILVGALYPEFRSLAWVFAASLPALQAQDAMRYVCFRMKRPRAAALSDLCWVSIQLFGFSILLLTAQDSAVTVTAVWGVAGALAAGASCVTERVTPSLRSGFTFLRNNLWASKRLLIDAFLVNASTQALPPIVVATSGLAAAGTLRAGQTLLGGISMVVLGLSPVLTVEAVRFIREGRNEARIVLTWTLLLGALAALYGLPLMLLPNSTGVAILGQNWEGARSLLLPLVIQSLIRGPYTGVQIILKAHYKLDAALRLRLWTSVPSLACPAIGAVLDGALGAAWGIAVGAMLVDVQSMITLRKHTRQDKPRATPHRLAQ